MIHNKGAFPSVAVDRLLHDLQVRGIPKAHTNWLQIWLDGRRTKLVFNGFTSEEFDIDGRLNQGDPQSVISYLLYNSGLAEIPKEKKGESSVLFVDNNSVLAVGRNFNNTGRMICNMFKRKGGIDEWVANHNCNFGIKKYQLCQLMRK
jgi:Reverse transcriptase (RNA-dependent DNA polymerase)